MITILKPHGDSAFSVDVLRQQHATPRSGILNKTLFKDKYVELSASFNDNNNPVSYTLRFRKVGELPHVGQVQFWAVLFYRKESQANDARPLEMAYSDKYVRLLKFGQTNPDYMLAALCPSPEHRAGDKRFSTIPDIHSIEQEGSEAIRVVGTDHDEE